MIDGSLQINKLGKVVRCLGTQCCKPTECVSPRGLCEAVEVLGHLHISPEAEIAVALADVPAEAAEGGGFPCEDHEALAPLCTALRRAIFKRTALSFASEAFTEGFRRRPDAPEGTPPAGRPTVVALLGPFQYGAASCPPQG